MENPNIQLTTDLPKEIPQFSSESAAYLIKAAKWGKFLAILGFIVTALLVLFGILLSFIIGMLPEESVPSLPLPAGVMSFMYILIAAIYIVPVIFLNSFCNSAIKAVNLGSTDRLTDSIRNLKNLFVFVGISTIVLLVLYTVAIVLIGTVAILSM
jgi:hypothetical protein